MSQNTAQSHVSFSPLDPAGADREQLISFLAENSFPFHMTSAMSREEAVSSVDSGRWKSESTEPYWVEVRGERVGVVTLEDLDDDNPVFDLRLAEEHRGQGLGAPVLRALTALAFESCPEIRRFEGQTREDNIAMRRTFLRCGFLKEAHYREGWPVSDGEPLASVAYAILRQDWISGTVTEFVWEDLTV